MGSTTRPLRTATYVLRFTEEEKAELEAKVERAAAEGKVPLTLAHALRMGAKSYLDELLSKYEADGDEQLAGS
jgi:formate dehydrogenase maturation protein FdhE